MQAKKNEAHMSSEERLTILEVTILNINASLLDIKQDLRRQADKMDSRFDTLMGKTDSRFDALTDKTDSRFDTLMDKTDSRFDAFLDKMDSRFDAVDRKLKDFEQDMDRRFETTERRLESLDRKFEFIHNRLWTMFIWLISMIIGLAGLIAHTQHWI